MADKLATDSALIKYALLLALFRKTNWKFAIINWITAEAESDYYKPIATNRSGLWGIHFPENYSDFCPTFKMYFFLHKMPFVLIRIGLRKKWCFVIFLHLLQTSAGCSLFLLITFHLICIRLLALWFIKDQKFSCCGCRTTVLDVESNTCLLSCRCLQQQSHHFWQFGWLGAIGGTVLVAQTPLTVQWRLVLDGEIYEIKYCI